MSRSRGVVVGFLVLVLLFGLGGAQPSPGAGGPSFALGDVRGWLRDSLGVDAWSGWSPWPGSGGSGSSPDSTGELALPRDEVAPAAEQWPEPERVGELVERRTANGRFFELSDGRVQAEISTAPVHYEDEDGVFRPIDTTVTDVSRPGFVKGNATNTFTSLFGDRTDRLVRFELDGRHVELGLAGPARAVEPVVDGSRVTYPGVAGGADLVYVVTPRELREEIVLAQPPAGGFSVQFTVDTVGVEAVPRPDGSIGFVPRAGGEPVFVMPAPFMFDASAQGASRAGAGYSDRVSQTVEQDGSTTTVRLTADAGWLADPARVYPVTVDPTVRIQPVPTDAQDVEIYAGDRERNYNDTYQLRVGTDASSMWRTLVQFPLTGVPAGTQVDDARLEMFYDQTHTTWEHDVSLQVHRVTAPWDESTATWSNIAASWARQPVGNRVTVDDGSAGTAVTGSWPFSGNPDLTPLALNDDYRFNNDAATGDTHTWVPTLTEDGEYQVDAHFVSGSDRPSNVEYTVVHDGGSRAYSVDQSGVGQGVWRNLGVHPFQAGTAGRVVLGDVANRAAIADAVRFTKWGVATKQRAVSSVWTRFPVRNVVQDWLDGAQPNHGFVIRAQVETTKGRGGPIYEASEFAYQNDRRDYNLPRLVVTFGRPGTAVDPPTLVTATGAALSWPAYQDPTGPDGGGDDIVEYQVHRSVFQTYVPSQATLVAPVGKSRLSYQDTSATPTPTHENDPLKQNFFYYMVAVKTADGQVIAGPTQGVQLPKAGQITRIFRETTSGQVPDTTLSAARPNENVNVYDGDPYVSPGNNSSFYGDTRGLVKFDNLAGIPADAKVVDAQLRMWNTSLFPGTDTNEFVDVYRVTRDWAETGAAWNQARPGVPWTTPGGDFTGEGVGFNGFTNDPEWEVWNVEDAVNTWLTNPASNHGLLLRQRDEVNATARAMLLSSEGAEPLVRPTLQVTYLQQDPVSTYHAPETPTTRMIPGDDYTIDVTVSNPTPVILSALEWELSYRWQLPDGTDVTTGGNQLASPLPADIPSGGAVDIAAALRTPIQSDAGNKRSSYVLRWELRNKLTGQWLSEVHGIGSLDQNVVVEDPTSDELGLEQFYQYTVAPTGSGSSAYVNAHSGNAVYEYSPIANPGRGVATFARMVYNSQDTSASSMGFGWSLSGSTITRLGSPLEFHPKGQDWPTDVTLVDGDGTSHFFTLDKHGSTDPADWEYASPAGVHLLLQRNHAAGDPTRAWVMTKPDRTQFFFDTDGYPSAVVDRNGNTQTFTYEERRSANKPIKFLQYVTDPTGRQTLTLDYYQKGDDYQLIDDNGDLISATNLTDPHIIDQVRSITDVDGRRIELTYTDKGLMARLVDGAGTPEAKTFQYAYDALQGNKNVKLVQVTDPRGNTTDLAYYNPPPEPKFHWWTQAITDRRGGLTQFGYVDPDGPAGSVIETMVTDAESHAAEYVTDGFGRPTEITDAKNQVNRLTWDADNNVVQHEENNGATSTWTYDQDTGYPLTIRDAEANASGTPATVLTYQTGLGGHIADLVGKTSPEGRSWGFDYDLVGNLTAVTDPKGTSTSDPDDFTTRYTYDPLGQLLTATDPNGNTTSYDDYQPVGYPRIAVDALGNDTITEYDKRGNVTSVTDALEKVSTFGYDLFSRPLESVVPKDQEAGEFITTPAPVYDPNDNVTVATAPNGAVTTVEYDPADRPVRVTLPQDTPVGPQRVMIMTYDSVGNLVSETEPNGNLTAADPDDFVTRYVYDEIYQLVEMIDADGGRFSQQFDGVGNVVKVVDGRKNATADLDDFTLRSVYDLKHQVVEEIDAAGHSVTYQFDRDGMVVATTDQEGVTTQLARDERGLVTEMKVPHQTVAGSTTFRTTRFEYDQAGNPVATITPRGVETAAEPDDFVERTVYDALNRPVEEVYPFDPNDPDHATPAKTVYRYDEVGNLVEVSAPPSQGQTVRNDTGYQHFDNGWVRESTDPWDITTRYDYNLLGQQAEATVTSAGGSQSRTIGWDYFPDGKLRSRSDSGVPVGQHVVLVDNSDTQHTTAAGTWGTSSTGEGFQGFNYRRHAAGTSGDTFRWRLTIPAGGDYEVFVRYAAGTATDAPYTITHAGGTATVPVDQSQQVGEWVSVGSYTFNEGIDQDVSLATSAGGTVVADAVKLVRDASGETDTEQKSIEYAYDANGNLVLLTDASEGALVDEWSMSYDGLNRVSEVQERAAGVAEHVTSLTYDPNGNPLTRTHDSQTAQLVYDVRDAVSQVTHTEPGVTPKVSTFSYTPKGRVETETAANGNTVSYDYFLDGMVRSQVERRADATVVNQHTLTYTANSHLATDVARTQNADNHAELLERTYSYEYDPRDRLTGVTRTGVAGGGEKTQTYVLDDNSNTVSQTVDGQTTNYVYDRNRLQSATAVGGTTSVYNYDPYGRLDTVVSAGEVIEKYTYDGFDRTVAHRAGTGADATTTEYVYDPFDRTLSRTRDAGGPEEKTTSFAYLGVEAEVAAEQTDGVLSRTYQYGGQGERLSMLAHDQGGTGPEFSVYGYDSRGSVELITDPSGNARATYGYTAYGQPDPDLMTGVDKPDPADPDAEPYNTYRYQAKQLDPATGNYDMGARDYDPGLNRFLSRDMFAGALADLSLAVDAFTMNRYAFAGGNPLSRIEFGGHFGLSDLGHLTLDVVGLVPVVGEAADLANAAWYAAEGDYVNAALSAASAIPFVGWGASAIKAGTYIYKGVDAARSGSRYLDEAADVAGATQRADVPTSSTPDAPSAPRDTPDAPAAPRDTPTQPPPASKPAPAPAPAKPSNGPSCPVGNSFTPDTPVAMADGSTKPIEDVQVGDRVLATDPTTGRTAARPVVALIVGQGIKDLVEVTVETDDGDTGTVIATDAHPFWASDAADWVEARDLRPGQDLLTPTGTQVEVTTVEHTTRHQRVHNLTIANIHTYHVVAGDTPVLVHNCKPEVVYPPNHGFNGPSRTRVLQPGDQVDRFGYPGGRYVSPNGTPFEARSLPASSRDKPYQVYEVTNRLVVRTGEVKPWFGQPGKGIQHYLPASVQDLTDAGYLRPLG